MIIETKMTRHCIATERVKKRKRVKNWDKKRDSAEMGFKTRVKGGERWRSGDM